MWIPGGLLITPALTVLSAHSGPFHTHPTPLQLCRFHHTSLPCHPKLAPPGTVITPFNSTHALLGGLTDNKWSPQVGLPCARPWANASALSPHPSLDSYPLAAIEVLDSWALTHLSQKPGMRGEMRRQESMSSPLLRRPAGEGQERMTTGIVASPICWS